MPLLAHLIGHIIYIHSTHTHHSFVDLFIPTQQKNLVIYFHFFACEKLKEISFW